MAELFSDEYFMQLALREAQRAFDEDEVPVGAVVVCNNQVIAKGYNQTEKLTDVTAHAEMLSLTAAFSSLNGKYLKECTLFVTLEPCVMCAGALYWSQITRVVYGASDPKRGFLKNAGLVLHPRTVLQGGILAAESEQLIKTFFQRKRN